MKKTIYILISLILFSIFSLVIYWNLPFELTRKSDIKYGNTLIENFNTYIFENKKLPESDDWKTLEKIGFKSEMLGVSPNYETNEENEYEIIFFEGFDGPYLMWNSKEKKWKIDFPTNYTKSD